LRTLLERQLAIWRLAPWLIYGLVPVVFFLLCLMLVERSEHLSWAIVAMGLSAVSRLSGQARNDFLRGLFRGGEYRRIRLAENGLLLLPFVVFLLVKGFWAQTLVLGIVGMSSVWWIARFARALPPPFSRRPFEFTVGFRRYWWLLLIAGVLLYQGVRVMNFELSMFAAVLVMLAGSMFLSPLEPGEFVSVHTLTPKAFLHGKVRLLCGQLFLLVLPFLLTVAAVFPGYWLTILIIVVYGYVFFLLNLVIKYAIFPKVAHVGHAIIITFGMIFLPFGLYQIYLFYRRALVRLEILLP